MEWARMLVAALLAALGVAAGRLGVGTRLSGAIVVLLVWFSLPVLGFYTVLISAPRLGLWGVIAGSALLMALGTFGVYAAARLLGYPCHASAAAGLAAGVPNVVFLAIPLALLLGQPLDPVVAYGVGYIAVVATVAPLVASACRGCGAGALLGLLARYPPLYAAAAAAILLALHVEPGWATTGLLARAKTVAGEATLLSFYVVGEAVARLWPPRMGRLEALVAAWRLSPRRFTTCWHH